MSIPLRIMLIVASILTGIYIRKQLRKSQMRIEDVLFWLFFAVILIFMSVFPEAVAWFTDLVGVQSPVNFVFLVVIFLLLVRCFALSVKVSFLEAKLNEVVETMAINKLIHEESAEVEYRDTGDHNEAD